MKKQRIFQYLLYTACLWLIGCMGFMMAKLDQADQYVAIWFPLVWAGSILAILSVVFNRIGQKRSL